MPSYIGLGWIVQKAPPEHLMASALSLPSPNPLIYSVPRYHSPLPSTNFCLWHWVPPQHRPPKLELFPTSSPFMPQTTSEPPGVSHAKRYPPATLTASMTGKITCPLNCNP